MHTDDWPFEEQDRDNLITYIHVAEQSMLEGVVKNVLDLSFHMLSAKKPQHVQVNRIRSVNFIKLIQKLAPIGEQPGN